MQKALYIGWILTSVALVWLFIYIWLYGGNSDRTELAGNLGAIWGGLTAICGWNLWKARKGGEKAKGASNG